MMDSMVLKAKNYEEEEDSIFSLDGMKISF